MYLPKQKRLSANKLKKKQPNIIYTCPWPFLLLTSTISCVHNLTTSPSISIFIKCMRKTNNDLDVIHKMKILISTDSDELQNRWCCRYRRYIAISTSIPITSSNVSIITSKYICRKMGLMPLKVIQKKERPFWNRNINKVAQIWYFLFLLVQF